MSMDGRLPRRSSAEPRQRHACSRERLRRAPQRGPALRSRAVADRPDRLGREGVATTFQSVPPSVFPAPTEPPDRRSPESEIARTTPARRPVEANTPQPRCPLRRRRSLGEGAPGFGLVCRLHGRNDTAARRPRPRAGVSRACVRSDPRPSGRDERAWTKRVAEAAREAGRNEASFPEVDHGSEADERRPRSGLPAVLLLHPERAGERQAEVAPRLRTVSFTLEVVAIITTTSSKPGSDAAVLAAVEWFQGRSAPIRFRRGRPGRSGRSRR